MGTIRKLTQQRNQLIEIVRSFMQCQAADGTTCAPNADEFAAAALALADIAEAERIDEESPWRSPAALERDRIRYEATLATLQSYDLGHLPGDGHNTEWWRDYIRSIVGGIQQIAKNALEDECVNQ